MSANPAREPNGGPSIADGAQWDEGTLELDELYRSFAGQLVSRLAQRTGCRDTARDLVQETFAKFLGVTRSKRAELQNPEAYLRRISSNLVNDWGRSRSHRHAAADELGLRCGIEIDEVRRLESRDTLRRLESAMLKLKPRTREIFLAHRLDGLSYAEIAESTGLTVKGVAKQMSKAIAKIDRLLDRS